MGLSNSIDDNTENIDNPYIKEFCHKFFLVKYIIKLIDLKIIIQKILTSAYFDVIVNICNIKTLKSLNRFIDRTPAFKKIIILDGEVSPIYNWLNDGINDFGVNHYQHVVMGDYGITKIYEMSKILFIGYKTFSINNKIDKNIKKTSKNLLATKMITLSDLIEYIYRKNRDQKYVHDLINIHIDDQNNITSELFFYSPFMNMVAK